MWPSVCSFQASLTTSRKTSFWVEKLKGYFPVELVKKCITIGEWSKSPSERKVTSELGKESSQSWFPITPSFLLKTVLRPVCLLFQVKKRLIDLISEISQSIIQFHRGTVSVISTTLPIRSLIFATQLKSPATNHGLSTVFSIWWRCWNKIKRSFLSLEPYTKELKDSSLIRGQTKTWISWLL